MSNKPQDIKVLVIDDEQGIREGSERILTRMGFSVNTAPRGDKGLEILKSKGADIVLLDLKMPGIDGMEVLRRIREKDQAIIVIVITGYATVETAIEAMKQGAYDFIPKPFEPDQLRIVVNRAWERIRLTRETEELERRRRITLADLDTEKSRIRTIIESLPNGLLATGPNGHVVLMNPAFRQMLNLPPDMKAGDPIEQYIPDTGLCNLVMEISKGRHVDYDDIPDYEFSLSDDLYLLAKAQPVLGEHRECLGAVVNFMDISAMKVVDRLKSEFMAKVTHELRSPLSTIHEQLATALKDVVGGDAGGDHYLLTRAKEKTQGLISLIGDLLDLSRIEEGRMGRDPQPVHVDEVLRNVTEFINIRAEGKKQTLSLKLPDLPIPLLMADPVAIESIFGNLITNAVNYTQEGGEIRVEADMAGINIRVKVADNGFGIPEKHMDKIFERFHRVKDDKTRFITGTGLGLPIVKSLVESLNGFIQVDSTHGKGSIFTVLLPVKSDG